MKVLEDELNKHIKRINENKNEDLLEIYHLYYDEYLTENIE